MTNGWIDIKNTDMMLIMGGNPAENHPCGFKWAVEAKRNRNAKLICVDPRFTRTASQADLFVQIRAGTDTAFLGGLISYAIAHDRVAKEYLVNYTNAAFLIKDGFKLPEDGLFSGFNDESKTYDKATWNYQEGGNETGKAVPVAMAGESSPPHEAKAAVMPVSAPAKGTPAGTPPPPPSLPANVAYDLSLQHPRCVYQLLKQQYSRYTPETVSRITGIPQDQLLKAYDLYTSIRKDGDTKKVATIIYAVGWTQHSFGTQIIRTACIFDILPGYLKMPAATEKDLKTYLERITPKPSKPNDWESFNYWSNTPKFAVSFLKAMYGNNATKENDFAFNHLPKLDRNYSWVNIWNDMYNGKVKGFFAFGMNGVMIGPDTQKNIDALKKADF